MYIFLKQLSTLLMVQDTHTVPVLYTPMVILQSYLEPPVVSHQPLQTHLHGQKDTYIHIRNTQTYTQHKLAITLTFIFKTAGNYQNFLVIILQFYKSMPLHTMIDDSGQDHPSQRK